MPSLEAKVSAQTGGLKAMHSNGPDPQLLKRLGQEVPEAKPMI